MSTSLPWSFSSSRAFSSPTPNPRAFSMKSSTAVGSRSPRTHADPAATLRSFRRISGVRRGNNGSSSSDSAEDQRRRRRTTGFGGGGDRGARGAAWRGGGGLRGGRRFGASGSAFGGGGGSLARRGGARRPGRLVLAAAVAPGGRRRLLARGARVPQRDGRRPERQRWGGQEVQHGDSVRVRSPNYLNVISESTPSP